MEAWHVGDLAHAQLALALSMGVELLVRIWVRSREFWTVFAQFWVHFWSILDSGPNVDPGPALEPCAKRLLGRALEPKRAQKLRQRRALGPTGPGPWVLREPPAFSPSAPAVAAAAPSMENPLPTSDRPSLQPQALTPKKYP